MTARVSAVDLELDAALGALARAVDVPAALESLSQVLARALAIEHCALVLWDDAPGRDAMREMPGVAEAVSSGRPARPDARTLVVPLGNAPEPPGVCALTAPAAEHWTPEEVERARALAGRVGLGAEVVRLRRQARAHAAETERALAELRAAQERLVAGETLRALGKLASGTAHHLNNLLTIVVGRVQLLRRAERDARVQRSIEIVERAAKDGAEVVRRLQQFAGAGEPAEVRLVDLNHVVSEVLDLTRVRWQEAGRVAGAPIEVETRLAAIPMVPGDPLGVRELLVNLVLNAVDALPAGGRITLTTEAEPGHAVVTVADTGVGMSPEVLRRAPEPFFTTKGVRATGLGLSVSYGIARRHDGEIRLASEEGRGTTVTVRLPLAPPTPG